MFGSISVHKSCHSAREAEYYWISQAYISHRVQSLSENFIQKISFQYNEADGATWYRALGEPKKLEGFGGYFWMNGEQLLGCRKSHDAILQWKTEKIHHCGRPAPMCPGIPSGVDRVSKRETEMECVEYERGSLYFCTYCSYIYWFCIWLRLFPKKRRLHFCKLAVFLGAVLFADNFLTVSFLFRDTLLWLKLQAVRHNM